MNNSPERCSQLRTLYDQLTKQIKVLRESVQKAEREGVESPVETKNVIRSLEKSLHTTALELQECPPEISAATSSSSQQQGTGSYAPSIRRLFPDAEQDEEEEGDSIVDEY